jgi:hypothetical protein
VKLYLNGSADPVPSARFTSWGYAATFRISWQANTAGRNTEGYGGQRLALDRKEGPWTPAANLRRVSSSLLEFDLPESALRDSYCDASGCDPIQIKFEAFEDHSRAGIVASDRARWDSLEYTKIEVLRPEESFVPVDLQFSAGQGFWATSNLLTRLPSVPGTRPPQFRATIASAQLRASAVSWRWRVGAALGGRTTNWCHLQIPASSENAVKAGQPTPKSLQQGAGTGSQQTALGNPKTFATRQEDTNRPGGDYQDLELASAARCQSACTGDAKCMAWSWVKPGIQGVNARCWLKNSVPNAVSDACCTSGVKSR